MIFETILVTASHTLNIFLWPHLSLIEIGSEDMSFHHEAMLLAEILQLLLIYEGLQMENWQAILFILNPLSSDRCEKKLN